MLLNSLDDEENKNYKNIPKGPLFSLKMPNRTKLKSSLLNRSSIKLENAIPIKVKTSDHFMENINKNNFMDKREKSLILSQHNLNRCRETYSSYELSRLNSLR